MAATEIVTVTLCQWGGKEILEPKGTKGNSYASLGDWLLQKRSAGIAVYDVTNSVIVKGVDKWAAFDELYNNNVLRTIFEIG